MHSMFRLHSIAKETEYWCRNGLPRRYSPSTKAPSSIPRRCRYARAPVLRHSPRGYLWIPKVQNNANLSKIWRRHQYNLRDIFQQHFEVERKERQEEDWHKLWKQILSLYVINHEFEIFLFFHHPSWTKSII